MSRKTNPLGNFVEFLRALKTDAETNLVMGVLQQVAKERGITLRYFRPAARKSRQRVNGKAVAAPTVEGVQVREVPHATA